VERYCKNLNTPSDRCTGGAAQFLTAIGTEMIPLLAAKFPIDTAQLGLFGISAGGFFSTWVIFQPNTPFNKYIISSPGMAYGHGETFRQEADYAKTHKDLAVGVYMAVPAGIPAILTGSAVRGPLCTRMISSARHKPRLAHP
jgi:predicted alpha/beta superfamily hydrolase